MVIFFFLMTNHKLMKNVVDKTAEDKHPAYVSQIGLLFW